jgi:antitoxin VapB
MAIRKSVEERVQRIKGRNASKNLAAKLLEIGALCARLPEMDNRTPDEILGYDENGLPR